MRGGVTRAVVVVAGRTLPPLAALLDPAAFVLRVVQRRLAPPDPLAVVLLLGLAGAALYLWTRRGPPE